MCIVLPLRRVIQTALVFSLLAYYVSLTERRQGQKLDSRTQWTGTYTSNRAEEYSELGFETPWPPDTTVVILNWSRLPNVIHLARIMCSSLQDTVMEVFVWNNNPTALTQEVGSSCSKRREEFLTSVDRILQNPSVQAICSESTTRLKTSIFKHDFLHAPKPRHHIASFRCTLFYVRKNDTKPTDFCCFH
jgi:hypothetical protein